MIGVIFILLAAFSFQVKLAMTISRMLLHKLLNPSCNADGTCVQSKTYHIMSKNNLWFFSFFHCVKSWCAKTFLLVFYSFCFFADVYYFIHNRTNSYSLPYVLPTYSQLKNACSFKESFCQKPSKSVLPFPLPHQILLPLIFMNAYPIFPFIIDKYQLIMIIGIINHTTS